MKRLTFEQINFFMVIKKQHNFHKYLYNKTYLRKEQNLVISVLDLTFQNFRAS